MAKCFAMQSPTSRSGFAVAAAVALAVAVFVAATALAGGAFDIVPRHTAGIILWWLALVGAAFGLRTPGRPMPAGILATALGAALAVWAGIGIGPSLSAERSATEFTRYIVHLAPLVLVGWVLPREHWRSVIVGVAAGGVAVCLAALGERLSPGLLEDTRTIVFENTSSRLSAPLGYWNGLGSWAVLTGLLLLAMGSHFSGLLGRTASMIPVPLVGTVIYLTYSRSALLSGAVGCAVLLVVARNRFTLLVHIVCAVALTLLAIATIRSAPEIANQTGSADAGKVLASVVAACLVAGLVGLSTARIGTDALRLPTRAGRLAAVVLTLAVTGIVVGTAVTEGPALWERFSAKENETGDPTQRLTMINNGTRVEQWRLAIASFEGHPLRGTGAGTFEMTNNLDGTDAAFVRDAHSLFLESLSEQGAIGFALLVGFFGSVLAVAISAARRARETLDRGLVAGAIAAIAAFVIGASADWFWEVTALALLAMFLIGALIAAASESGDSRSSLPSSAPEDGVPGEADDAGPPNRGLAAWPLRATISIVSGCAMLALLPGLVGMSEIRRSQRAVDLNDLAAAREHANQAIETMPWASSPFLQRALVDEQASAWNAARRSLQLGIKRDPYDWRLPLVLARVEAKAGDAEAAIVSYRRAKSLRPNGQFFQ